jgi:hypothetical protein
MPGSEMCPGQFAAEPLAQFILRAHQMSRRPFGRFLPARLR